MPRSSVTLKTCEAGCCGVQLLLVRRTAMIAMTVYDDCQYCTWSRGELLGMEGGEGRRHYVVWEVGQIMGQCSYGVPLRSVRWAGAGCSCFLLCRGWLW
jgi:hypothetical protein